jgi:hypothetical protein
MDSLPLSSLRPLSASQIVRIWELGQSQHPLDRALVWLACACPDRSLAELAELSIGQRDAALLTLRELTFGPKLDSQATCPRCQEQLEFALNVSDIRVPDPRRLSDELVPNEVVPDEVVPDESVPAHRSAHHHVQAAGLDLTFRLPNSLDLAAIAPVSLEEARSRLAQRCLLQATRQGQPIALEDISDGAIAHLSQYLAEADPQAEIVLDLQCPACQHQWQVLFDIVAFFWSEIQVQAQRLLQEVHVLASAYGWREADILSMTSTRRQYYLELVR